MQNNNYLKDVTHCDEHNEDKHLNLLCISVLVILWFTNTLSHFTVCSLWSAAVTQSLILVHQDILLIIPQCFSATSHRFLLIVWSITRRKDKTRKTETVLLMTGRFFFVFHVWKTAGTLGANQRSNHKLLAVTEKIHDYTVYFGSSAAASVVDTPMFFLCV